MDVSESTVSRLMPGIAQFSDFLAALELKVVPASAQCVSAQRMQSLKALAEIGICHIDQVEDEF